jgi:hypothetical protein
MCRQIHLPILLLGVWPVLGLGVTACAPTPVGAADGSNANADSGTDAGGNGGGWRDAGGSDSGGLDAGASDAGGSDSGASDGGVLDAGQADAGLVLVNALAPLMQAPSGGCPGTGGTPGYCEFFQYVVPHVTGISAFLFWNEVDNGAAPCVEGSTSNPCNWSNYDAQLATYVSAGLQINLIVIGVNEGGTSNHVTPAYVFAPSYAQSLGAPPQDMVVCELWPGAASSPVHGSPTVGGVWNSSACYSTSGTCAGSTDTNGFPVVYEKPYITAYQGFIANVLEHYSSRGTGSGPTLASHIGYIRFGMTAGGEGQLFCSNVWPGPEGLATQPLGYSKDIYLGSVANPASGYISSMVTWIHAQCPSVATEINTAAGPPADTDLSYADTQAQLAVANHVGIGMEALNIGDAYEFAQGKPCVDDWCANFETYAGAGVPLVLQTALPTTQPVYGISTISGDGQMATATCATPCNFYRPGWVTVSGSSAPDLNGTFQVAAATATSFSYRSTSTGTGTGGTVLSTDYLPISVPFAVSEHATALEIYLCDLLYAFDPNPVAGLTCSNPPGPYSAKYATTITSADGK